VADHVLPVVDQGDELLSPLTYCVPLELLAYHFASSKGHVMLGFDQEWRRRLNFRQIFGE
jgi:glucosamine 6-phosphate synthetase-like amidotransferase/phosphosugar isomerase protein